MNLKNQKYDILYPEYINDYNLIIIAIDVIRKSGINYTSLDDIAYFIHLFKQSYKEYQGDIKKSLEEFIQNNSHILAHTPSNKYIVGSQTNIDILKNRNDIGSIYDHYNIEPIEDEYKEYLESKQR